jgi:hypothetical protein
MRDDKKTAFETSADEKDASLLSELLSMLKENKKYWLIPLVLVLLLFGVLIILGSGAAAPFIYTLF